MNSEFQNLFFKIEIAWSFVWTFLLVSFYVCLYLNSFSGVVLFLDLGFIQIVLQILIFMASILSLVVFCLKRFGTPVLEITQNDLLAEGGRIVFPVLNIAYYGLNTIDFFKINFNFLWLILPWLLWLPIIIDLSTQVKREFSWIK
jgi:hypothetical protein